MHIEKMMDGTTNLILPEQPMPITASTQKLAEEIGGLKGPEPTRYADWEKNGRCFDF